MYENKDKLKASILIKELYKDKNSLSVTLTGSYSENFNIKKAGDIDIIIICKKLTKIYFKKCINKLKKLKKRIFGNDLELIINSTFGPIKFYKKNSIVFHLMIYDLESHIDHTIKSPFTCYDWERSNFYVGKSLKELSPVFNLQLRDFYEARRSTLEYLKDIMKNRISYREYKFIKNKYYLVKKHFVIDEINKRDFIYHTIKFLLINFIKFESNINFKVNEKKIDDKFYQIVGNKNLLKKFKELKKLKSSKSKENIKNAKNLAINFIKNFDKHIKNKIKSNSKIYFVRHKKTKVDKNIFLGQKINPSIINNYMPLELKNLKIKRCISSPSLRCLQTGMLLFKERNIYINNYLKEIDYGRVENLNYNDLKKKYPKIIKMWSKGKDPKFPGGESTKDVLIRLNKFLKFLITNSSKFKQNTLVITHNVFLRCLIGSHYNIPVKDWYNININYIDLLEFSLKKKNIRPNISRKKFLYLFSKFYPGAN